MLSGKGVIRVRDGVVRADDDVFGSKQFFFSPHPLTNFQIKIFYQINLNLKMLIHEIIYQKLWGMDLTL